MQIREANAGDEPALSERLLRPSYRESAEVAPAYNTLDEAAVADADGSRWLEHDDRALFVATRDGTLVGHVSGITTDAPPIYDRPSQVHIDGLYVVPDARREGIATRLLDRIERWADDRGCGYVGVTVHVANEGARRVYEDRYDRTFHSYRHELGRSHEE